MPQLWISGRRNFATAPLRVIFASNWYVTHSFKPISAIFSCVVLLYTYYYIILYYVPFIIYVKKQITHWVHKEWKSIAVLYLSNTVLASLLAVAFICSTHFFRRHLLTAVNTYYWAENKKFWSLERKEWLSLDLVITFVRNNFYSIFHTLIRTQKYLVYPFWKADYKYWSRLCQQLSKFVDNFFSNPCERKSNKHPQCSTNWSNKTKYVNDQVLLVYFGLQR